MGGVVNWVCGQVGFRLVFKRGSDEMSGLKEFIYTPSNERDQSGSDEPPAKKKKCEKCEKEKKQTKSLFTSQLALVALNAVFPDGRIEALWLNENANSIYSHAVTRQGWEKEDKCTYDC